LGVKPEPAIAALEALKIEAAEPSKFYFDSGLSESWKLRLHAVLRRSLGDNHELVHRLDNLEYMLDTEDYEEQKRTYESAVRYVCGCIEGAIYELQLDVAATADSSGIMDTAAESVDVDKKRARKVFVVHGRNWAARSAMFAILRSLGLDPIEWSEAIAMTGEASPFIGHVLDIGLGVAQAIVVLLTPDDVAYLRSEYASGEDDPDTAPLGQARPNVLFEAGMAMGRDPKRTVLVELGRLRPFSDVAGRHVLRMTDTPQKRTELAQRLKTAGCDVNMAGQDWLTAGDFAIPPPPGLRDDHRLEQRSLR
jgi:predicted nucleotide-binding protein